MAIKDFYPNIRPSLDLNFSGSRVVDPRTTFTRAGTGSVASYFDDKGTLKFAVQETPRIDFSPTTGECKGLLVEEMRTNLLTYSEQFDNVAWTKLRGTIQSNLVTSPAGDLTADTFTGDGSAGGSQAVHQSASVTASTSYAISIYAKAGTTNWFCIQLDDGVASPRVWFDLFAGAVGTVESGLSNATITNVGNGWYRCCVVITTSSTSSSLRVQFTMSSADTVESSSSLTSFSIWGAQLELGNFYSSYIQTTSAQVTRSADSAIMSGANFTSWFRQDEGTIFVEGALVDGGTGGRGVLRFDDGTETNRLMLRRNGANRIEARLITNNISVATFDSASTAITVGQNIKAAFSYKANDFAFSMNGIPVLTDTSGGLPAFTRFLIGDVSGTNNDVRACTIKRIAFYPKALPTLLQGMTS